MNRGACGGLTALLLGAVGSGCSRQDTECLARIGQKVLDHARHTTGEVRARLEPGWQPAPWPTAQDRVRERLRWDRALEGTEIEVLGQQQEVELKGTVKTPAQRQRALDLAETTAGVERVTETLQVAEPE